MIRMFVGLSFIMLSSAVYGQGMPAEQCGSCAEDLVWRHVCEWSDGYKKSFTIPVREGKENTPPFNKKAVHKLSNGTSETVSCTPYTKYCPRCIN